MKHILVSNSPHHSIDHLWVGMVGYQMQRGIYVDEYSSGNSDMFFSHHVENHYYRLNLPKETYRLGKIPKRKNFQVARTVPDWQN